MIIAASYIDRKLELFYSCLCPFHEERRRSWIWSGLYVKSFFIFLPSQNQSYSAQHDLHRAMRGLVSVSLAIIHHSTYFIVRIPCHYPSSHQPRYPCPLLLTTSLHTDQPCYSWSLPLSFVSPPSSSRSTRRYSSHNQYDHSWPYNQLFHHHHRPSCFPLFIVHWPIIRTPANIIHLLSISLHPVDHGALNTWRKTDVWRPGI